MTDTTDTAPIGDAKDAVREEAARWFARLNAGELTPEERRVFEAWRQEPDHEREFQSMIRLWDAAGHIPVVRLRALAKIPGGFRIQQRRAVMAFACVALLAIGVTAWFWTPNFAAEYSTQRGERLRVALPDGSTLDLNTQTRLIVKYYGNRRVVKLASGEALFDVKHDDAQPFVVETRAASVHDVGTRFDVLSDGDNVTVTVQSGVVDVTPPWWRFDVDSVRLNAGYGTRVATGGEIAAAAPADVTAVTAWREGKVVFDDRTLADVVHEIARYRERPIRLADSRVAQLRVSGIFSVDDTDALLRALPRLLPVRIRVLPDGSTEVSHS